MNRIEYYINKYKIALIISIITILLIVLCEIVIKSNKSQTEKLQSEIYESSFLDDAEGKEEDSKEIVEQLEAGKVKVDVKGKVKNPGVYELDEGSRVIDAINKAGGLLSSSNTDYINLSKKIKDEMIIIVYANSEIEQFKKEDKQIIYVEYECNCPDNINDTCITKEDTVNTVNSNTTLDTNNNNDKISINTGTLEELMTLNGIGESKAKAIIKYREDNGSFKKIEDLMNVSGIGASAYSKIKDNIKL